MGDKKEILKELLNIVKREYGTRNILRDLDTEYIINYINEELEIKNDKGKIVYIEKKGGK